MEIADLVIALEDLELDRRSAEESENNPAIRRNPTTMRDQSVAAPTGKPRRIHLRFLTSPVEITADEDGRVSSVKLERNELHADETGYLNSYGTGKFETLPACMVLRSVGYRVLPLEGVPYEFDAA